MAVSEKISVAIRDAVREAGQKDSLAKVLNAWFEFVASGSEDIDDSDASITRLEDVYADTAVDEESHTEE